MNTHNNSSESLLGERENGRIGRRAEAVLLTLRSFNSPPTDREIAAKLGFSDLNAVRPRITELIALGLVVEMGSVSCEVTGKTVRTTRALSLDEIEAARRFTTSTHGVQQELLPA